MFRLCSTNLQSQLFDFDSSHPVRTGFNYLKNSSSIHLLHRRLSFVFCVTNGLLTDMQCEIRDSDSAVHATSPVRLVYSTVLKIEILCCLETRVKF